MRSWLLVAILALPACRAPDRSFETEDGRKVRDIPALPYRVVLAVVDSDGRLEGFQPDPKKLEFTFTAHGIQKLLAMLLETSGKSIEKEFGVYGVDRQNGFDHVRIAIGRKLPDAMLQAQSERADLVIVPRLADLPELHSLGVNGRWATSTALWFTTWIFGLYVQDRRYLASLSLDFDVINPYDGSTLATYTTTSGRMDATLLERNKGRFGTDRTLISLFLPAWLIPDSVRRTSTSLSVRACERIAGQLARSMKRDFARRAREITGTLQRVHPHPRQPVGRTSTRFEASLVARGPITDIQVYVNGSNDPVYEAHADGETGSGGLPAPEEQVWGGVYRVNFATPEFELPTQENWVHVEFAVEGRYASQSFRYLRDPPKPPGE